MIAQAGGSDFDVAEHPGHRTLAMAKRYAHLNPGRKRTVAELTLRQPAAGGSRLRSVS